MLSFVSHCWVISHEKKRKKEKEEIRGFVYETIQTNRL